MLKLNISPLARAVGVMGATAALVGGITFAALTSNTVALTNNTLATASAHLNIKSGGATPVACTNNADVSAPGMNFTKLTPGVQSDAFNFCLGNDGDVPLNVMARIPTDLSGSTVDPTKVTLDLNCTTQGAVTGTLADFTAVAGKVFPTALPSGASDSCTAKVTLDSAVTSGSVSAFTLQFVGTQVTTPAPAPVTPS